MVVGGRFPTSQLLEVTASAGVMDGTVLALANTVPGERNSYKLSLPPCLITWEWLAHSPALDIQACSWLPPAQTPFQTEAACGTHTHLVRVSGKKGSLCLRLDQTKEKQKVI